MCWGRRKPCLHGSDAHKLEDVASAFGDRFWVKGGLEFDAIRQACIDPEGRAYVGEQPPRSAPSQVISHVRIDDADWATTPQHPTQFRAYGDHWRARFGQDGPGRRDRSRV
jgi:hypothetical protein